MKNQSQHIKGATRNITTICKSPLSLGQRKKDNDYSLSKNDRVNKKTTTIKTHIIQRSNIMKTNLANTFANRGMSLIILLVLFAAMAFGQGTFVISSGASFQPSTGTYTVKGNITNAAATSVTGIVTMAGTAAQTIGTSGNGTLTFPTLNINTTSATTTANVSTTVSGVLTIATGSTYDIGATTLTLGGTPATTGTLNVSNASGTVAYTGGSAQTIWGLTYVGAVTLSGAGAKNLSGTTSVAGTFTHSGGNLTVDQNLTISSTTPSFAAITNVVSGKSLTLSGTGAKSITTVTASAGTITNTGTTGLLTVGTLTANTGSILGNGSGITFTNAAANAGTITGGAGLITFSSTLSNTAGTVTAGAGGITFTGGVTQTGGSIASSALANLLKFSGSYSNSGGGTLDLTTTGAAEFDGTVTAGTFNLATGSTVTYGSSTAGQSIADLSYGNLILSNGTKSWTLGAARTINGSLTVNSSSAATLSGAYALNISGNATLASNVTVAGSVAFANAASTVSGAGEIVGSVTRTNMASGTAYAFNNEATTIKYTGGTLTSFTLTTTPGSISGTGYLANHTVARLISQTFTGTSPTFDIQLGYLSAEAGTAIQSRLRDFANGSAKANLLAGTYTTGTSANGFKYVNLVASATLTTSQQLALDDRFYSFNSIASTDWKLGSTWDQSGAVPGLYDDVNITGIHNVTVSDAEAANSVTIVSNSTDVNTLTINNGANTFAVGAGGLTDNNTQTGGGLVVTAGTLQVTTGNLTVNGNITNNGTITVQ